MEAEFERLDNRNRELDVRELTNRDCGQVEFIGRK
jgi:hypothetical protein